MTLSSLHTVNNEYLMDMVDFFTHPVTYFTVNAEANSHF